METTIKTFISEKMALEDQRKMISVLLSRGKTPTDISRLLKCSRSTVYRVKRRGAFKKEPGVRPRPTRTVQLINNVRETIQEAQGLVTQRGLSKDFNVPEVTMRRLLKNDLGLQCFKRLPRMALSSLDKKKRLERAKILLNEIKRKPKDVVILFSDETPFSLGEIVASNNRSYFATTAGAAPEEVKFIPKKRSYAYVQCIAVVASNGKKMDLVFLDDNERLSSDTYQAYLDTYVFPWARDNFGDKWWWQQDGASCHTSNSTQLWLSQQTPHFWPKHFWPPHSPDLSPLDFGIFGQLKGKLAGIKSLSKEDLKANVLKA